MILSKQEEKRLISIQQLINKRYQALPDDNEEALCLACISGAIEEYLCKYE